MKKNISKFFFRHSLMNPNCGHLVYAYNNDLLPKKIDFDQDIHELDIDEYLEMEDIFQEVDETNPMVEYFMILKQKVVNKFVEIKNLDLNEYYQNFQIRSKDMFANFDFLKINKKTKTIEFINVQPSIWEPDKLFKKTLSDRGATSKSLEKAMGFDITNFEKWNELQNAPNYVLINPLFKKEKFSATRSIGEIDLEYYNFIALIKTMIKDKIDDIKSSPKSVKLRIDYNQIHSPYLSPLIWKKTKSQIYFNFIYNFGVLLEKYPNYKIVGKIAFIQKDMATNNYDFVFYQKTIDNQNLSQIMKINKKKILQDLSFVREKKEKEGESWVPNARYLHYDLLNTNCKICQYGDEFFTQDVDVEKLNTMVPQIYESFLCGDVVNLLNSYPQKLAMLDFETITDPMPNQDYYHPWDKMIVQISCHLLKGTNIVKHYEYIVKDLSKKEMAKVYEMILDWIHKGYTLVSYYKPFENAVIRTMERILKRKEISTLVNVHPANSPLISENLLPVLDLFDYFKKRSKDERKWISWKKFNGSASIKYTIQIAHPKTNPYQDLVINNGFLATKVLYEHFNKKPKDKKTIQDLYKYCKQDTLSMVDIYKAIIKETKKRCED